MNIVNPFDARRSAVPLIVSLGVLLVGLAVAGTARADELVYQQTGADLAFAKYGLTGKGVVVAVLDRGIQWQNQDFIKPDGTTRIKYMLDMSGQTACNAGNPAPVEYSEAQINAALAGGPAIPERDAVGHGTATIGMAAGNGRSFANGKYKGIAPEADLIFVKTVSDGVAAHGSEPAEAAFQACYTQALQWLDQKLTELGKPGVGLINSESPYAPHDGTSIVSRTVDQYFGNRPGRAFAFPSGDEGGSPDHARGTFIGTQDTVVTFNRTSTAASQMAIWYPASTKARVTVTLNDGTTVGPLAPPGAPINTVASSADNSVVVRQFFPGAELYPTTSTSGDHYVQIAISGHATTGTIAIRGVTGTDTGTFDIYSDIQGVGVFTSNVVPGRISDWGTTRSSIVTGSYVVRTNYVDINGIVHNPTGQGAVGALWTGSNDGPTRDGRFGITVVSPGHNTLTSYATNSDWATFKGNEIQDGGGFYGLAGATSGATPIAAGAAALLLQLKPTLTSEQIRNYLQQSAKSDGFTGAVPSNTWGYGKLNILGALDLASTCTYTLNAGGQAFTAQGGSGTITVNAPSGCPWSVDGLPAGFTTTTKSGAGNGSINYQAAANAGAATSNTFSIGTQTFTVEEAASVISGLAPIGSLAQIASEGTWDFTLNAVNLGASSAQARFTFADDNGNPLLLPLTFPQLPAAAGPELAATLDRTINPNAQIVMESTGPNSVPLKGSGQLLSNGNVSAFGIFSDPTFGWNALVPLETRNASKYILAFDNTANLTTGLAVANLAGSAANIQVIVRDDTGAVLGTASISLLALGHTSFMLNAPPAGFPATTGKRGTIEFDTPNGGQITVLGLRAYGTAALTTLPVLANVGTGGGSITHIAYNGGFTSTFYIVNTGATSASFTLSFFDQNGNALSVPLVGAGAPTSTFTQTLAAGSMLVVQTQANDAAGGIVGSAQLTTTGNISGFEVFRWTTFNQEATVPLETRGPNSFILAFDDTNGLVTGVALTNLAATTGNITVKIYDDTGAQLTSPTPISLAPHGHTSFLLNDPQLGYPVTNNRRGIIEFVVPPGGSISAVGLRAKSDGTLTTIPVLAR
jgi:minor extracellular serine protease Vpr